MKRSRSTRRGRRSRRARTSPSGGNRETELSCLTGLRVPEGLSLTPHPAAWYTSRAEAGSQGPHRMPAGDPVLLEKRGQLWRLRYFCVLSGEFVIARPLRVNEQIRIRQVRVIDDAAQQLGVMPTEEALAMARTKGLDLIEVSPTAIPPVCRIGDYGRLKYEQSKKDKEARKKQRNWELREVKLRPKIDVHDYEVK